MPLSQAPVYTTSISLDTINGSSGPNKDLHMNVNLTIAGSAGQKQGIEFFVYYSTSSTVSSTNYMGMTTISVPAAQTNYKGIISGLSFLGAGVATGQQIYVVAYPSSAATSSSSKYIDETTGKTIYTALGTPSFVENYTVPH